LGAALARADSVLRERRASERAAAAALAESEARFRTLADNLPDGLVFRAVQGPEDPGGAASWRFTHISYGVERLHGVSAAAVLADPLLFFRRIAGGEHRARLVRELERAAAALDTLRLELPFRALPGGGEGPRWSRISAAPRRLPGGGVLWDGIEVDITAAKKAEDALRQAEGRFRSLFDAAPYAVVIFDPKTFAVLAFNDRACGDLGYAREEFARLTVMDIDALRDMEAIRRRARAHALRPGVQEFEARHRDKHGEVRDVLVRACGVVLDGREVAYTAHHDITERKEAEAALRAREAEFRAIFETSAAGMAEVDLRTGRYLRVNRRFCEMVGRGAAELTGGLGPDDIRHPDERDLTSGVAEAGASPDGRFEAERRYLRPDGAVVWVRGSVAVAGRDAEGRPARAAIVLKDITAQKQADELQTLLIREVDHRAKNALAVVQAMLRLTPAEGPEARRFAEALSGRVAAMARAHTLLSRDRWAGAELRDLAEAELAPYAGGGAAPGASGEERVRLDGPPALLVPEAAQPVGMVLHELATNAAKYGALSRPGGRVDISWRLLAGPAGGLMVEWRESGGPGLAAPPSRTGFGTRLVARTVRQIGGEAALDWAPEGLRCSFTIPANRLQAAAAARGAAREAEPAAAALAGPVA
jgi:PAS domain S-box-containing protein